MEKLIQGNQRLANRFAIFVDEGAEAVGPFAKRSEESVLGLSRDIIEARRREDTISFVHKPFLAVVVGIDIAVGLLPDLVALCVLATSVVGELGDGLVDDLVDEFAVVGEEVLNAVVLGGDESLRPIDIDRLVGADEDGVEGVVIDDAFLVEAGVVEALLVLVFDHGIDRRQHPLRCGVDESDLVVIDIDNKFVAVVEQVVLTFVLEALGIDDRAVAAEDIDSVALDHDTAVAGELPCFLIDEGRDELGGVEVDERTAVVLGEDSDGVAVVDVQPVDAVEEYLARLGIVDVVAVLVAEVVVADLLAVEFFLHASGGRRDGAAEGNDGGNQHHGGGGDEQNRAGG